MAPPTVVVSLGLMVVTVSSVVMDPILSNLTIYQVDLECFRIGTLLTSFKSDVVFCESINLVGDVSPELINTDQGRSSPREKGAAVYEALPQIRASLFVACQTLEVSRGEF